MNIDGGEEEGKTSSHMVPPLKSQKYFMAAQFLLRLLGMAAALAAAWIMVTSKESVVVYGTDFDAKYSYSPAFKFFAVANLMACAFSALSLFLGCILGRKTSYPINYFFVFLHDLVVMTVLMAACATATAIGYVGQYGNKYAGWGAICEYFDKYCRRVTVSVTLSYFAFLFYFCLAIISANMSRRQQIISSYSSPAQPSPDY